MPLNQNPEFIANIIKIFILAGVSTALAVLLTPMVTHFLYKYKLWKKEARTKTITGEEASVLYRLHKEREVRVPRFGGLLIWGTCLLVAVLFFLISKVSDTFWAQKLNFLSRSQTWLPLATLVAASIVGFFDDALQVVGSPLKIFRKRNGGEKKEEGYIAGGLSLSRRFLMVILIGLVGAWWFYFKLGWDSLYVPFVGDISIGLWYIPFFVSVMLATWSGGVIDGLDGLAGGVFVSMFGAFTVISFSLGKFDLAALSAVIAGAILAFLWFNIPPARFYMGETGMLGLTTTLAVVAFLTNSVLVLPIIGGLLVIESGSVILQLLSKKFRKKKIWLSTPIHHHFEAIGWPTYKVTMRFWIVGVIFAIVGVAVRLLG